MTAELLPSPDPTRTCNAGFASGNEDPRILAALEEFLSAGANGEQVPREEFLKRYPEIANELAACLEGLQFVQGVARDLQSESAVAGQTRELPREPIGDFRLLREIGRGGMGVVYEAEQISLKRRVALKVLPLASTLDPRHLQRFKNESLAAAHLNHPHIVPVYAVGCERGVHFYAMQYIEGQSLAGVIEELRKLEPANTVRGKSGRTKRAIVSATDGLQAPTDLDITQDYTPGPGSFATSQDTGGSRVNDTPRSAAAFLSTARSAKDTGYCKNAARLGQQAAEALEHAHQQGVIHRDIKPANLLLDARGELWIADFGLAQIQSDTQLTMTGDIVGTLRYMSPEQALGKGAALDHRTDVYALGATLYELLTLAPAVGGNDRAELLRRLASDEPVAPRRLNRAIPPELEIIVLKALAKEPAERYATAQDLADDLGRFLDDQPIRARAPNYLQRSARLIRRHKTLASVAALALFAVLAVSVVALAIVNKAVRREQAKTDAAKLKAENAFARQKTINEQLQESLARERALSYQQRIWLAARELKAGNPTEAAALLDECHPPLRNWEWRHLRAQCAAGGNILKDWPTGETRAPRRVEYSSTGEKLLFSHRDGLLLADAREGSVLWSKAFDDEPLRGATFSPQGATIAAWNDRLHLLTVDEGRVLETFQLPQRAILRAAFTPGGRELAALTSKDVAIWDLQTKKLLASLEYSKDRAKNPFHPHPRPVFSPDGRYLFVSFNGRLQIWDWRAQSVVRTRSVSARDEAWLLSPDGSRVAFLNDSYLPALWEWQGDKEPTTPKLPPSVTVHRLAFSPDSQLLAAAGSDMQIRIWETSSGAEYQSIRSHQGTAISQLAFSPGGDRLTAFAGDGSAPLPPAANRKGERKPPATADRTLKVWNVKTGQELRTIQDVAGKASLLAYSPDERQLAVVFKSGSLKLWNIAHVFDATQALPPTSSQPGFDIDRGIAFDPTLGTMASANSGVVDLRDTRTGEILRSVTLHDARHDVQRLAFSKSGSRLVALSRPRSALVLKFPGSDRSPIELALDVIDCQSGVIVSHRQVPMPLSGTAEVAVNSDGSLLAVGAENKLLTFDGKTGTPLQTLAQEGSVEVLAFHPTQPWCATGGGDHLVRVWDLSTGRVRHTFAGHEGQVTHVSFSAQGAKLVSAGVDQTVCIWNLMTDRLTGRYDVGANEFTALALSPNEERLATANSDLTVSIRDATNGRELLTLPGTAEPVRQLSFSADGRWLAAAFDKGDLKTWDTSPPTPDVVARHEARVQAAWHLRQAGEWTRKEAWNGVVWHLDKLLALQPDDAALRRRRVRALLSAGAWEQIEQADVESLKIDPALEQDRNLGYHAAYLFVSRGAIDAYQRLCRGSQDAADKESNAFRKSVLLRLCIVGPGISEPERLIDQTRSTLATYRDPFVYHYTLGGALYRAGKYQAAAEELEQAAGLKANSESQVLTWLFLALSRHQLGQTDEAAKWLAKSDEWIASAQKGQLSNTVPVDGISYRIALVFPLLREEARVLMGK